MNDPRAPRPLLPASAESSGGRVDAKALLASLHELRRHRQDEPFWAEFARCAALLCRAQASLCLRVASDGWQVLGQWQATESGLAGRHDALATDLFERLGDKGFGTVPAGMGQPSIALGIRLTQCARAMLVLEIPESERPRLNELVLRAQLISDMPADPGSPAVLADPSHPAGMGPQSSVAGMAATEAQGSLLAWLDLVIQVTRHRKFGAASLALVNGIAAQTGWTQVSLGWRRGPYVRMRAISHLDRFERRADHVRLIESAMEETLDYAVPVHDPNPDETAIPAISHARLRQGLG